MSIMSNQWKIIHKNAIFVNKQCLLENIEIIKCIFTIRKWFLIIRIWNLQT